MAIINRKTLTQQLAEAKAKSEAISQGKSIIPSTGQTYIYNQRSYAYGTGPLASQYPATPTAPTTQPAPIPYMPSQTGTQTGYGETTGQEDPIMKFNLAIMDMLTKAQEASDPTKLYEQQRALQRASLSKISEMTPEALRVLSPSQQAAIRGGQAEMLEPEIDAVAARIKAQDFRLRNFESMLDSARALGKDFLDTIKIKPDQEIVDGYIRMMEMGGDISSIPVEVRNDIISKMTQENWQAHDQAEITQKAKLTAAGKTTTPSTFTSQELRKLEQAGIDPDNRQEALDYLYAESEIKIPVSVIGNIKALMDKNASIEDIEDYINFSGYDINHPDIQELLAGYTPQKNWFQQLLGR